MVCLNNTSLLKGTRWKSFLLVLIIMVDLAAGFLQNSRPTMDASTLLIPSQAMTNAKTKTNKQKKKPKPREVAGLVPSQVLFSERNSWDTPATTNTTDTARNTNVSVTIQPPPKHYNNNQKRRNRRNRSKSPQRKLKREGKKRKEKEN